MNNSHNHDINDNHNHNHSHHHHKLVARDKDKTALIISMTVIGGFFIVEIVGGYISKSLALISDSFHMLTDFSALLISFFALLIAKLKPNVKKTYGYYRIEVLSALINAVLLFVVSYYIITEGIQRLQNPKEINIILMLIIASIGLLSNFIVVIILRRSKKSINIKGAMLHALSDTIASLGVIIGGLIIYFSNELYFIDTIISFGIAIIIIIGAVRLLLSAVNILLEATPKDIDIEKMKTDILDLKNIIDIYDLHIWSITSDIHSLSAHIKIDCNFINECENVLLKVKTLLKEKYNIEHTTLQLESVDYEDIGSYH